MGRRFNSTFRDNPDWKGASGVKGALKEYVEQRKSLVGRKKEASGPLDFDDGEGFADSSRSDGPAGTEGLASSGVGEVGPDMAGLEQVPGAGSDRPGVPRKKRTRKPGVAKKARRASAPKG